MLSTSANARLCISRSFSADVTFTKQPLSYGPISPQLHPQL